MITPISIGDIVEDTRTTAQYEILNIMHNWSGDMVIVLKGIYTGNMASVSVDKFGDGTYKVISKSRKNRECTCGSATLKHPGHDWFCDLVRTDGK